MTYEYLYSTILKLQEKNDNCLLFLFNYINENSDEFAAESHTKMDFSFFFFFYYDYYFKFSFG